MRIAGLAMALCLLLAACGSAQTKTIDTATLVQVLKGVGFRDLVVISNKKGLAKLARLVGRPSLNQHAFDMDSIITRGYMSPLVMPLTAVRLPSTRAAVESVKNDQRFPHGVMPPQEQQAMPRGYQVKRLSEVQICNVVLTSYNPSRDRSLSLRLQRAASRLRQLC